MNAQIWHWAASPPNSGWPWPHSSTSQRDGLWGDYHITNSLKREFASDSGTELNAVLPKMSPLNPLYLTKKQTVFQKIAAFVEKFKGVGGQV